MTPLARLVLRRQQVLTTFPEFVETVRRFETGDVDFTREFLCARPEQFARTTFLCEFRTYMDELWRRHRSEP